MKLWPNRHAVVRRLRPTHSSTFHRRLRLESLEDRSLLAVLTVNTTADTQLSDPDSVLSLREAIAVVNSGSTAGLNSSGELALVDTTEPLGVNDTIQFSSTLQNQTIALSLGQLNVTRAVRINGLGAALLTIDAGGGTNGVVGNFDGHTIFNILTLASGQVEISGLTLTGGDANLQSGGAISSQAEIDPREFGNHR